MARKSNQAQYLMSRKLMPRRWFSDTNLVKENGIYRRFSTTRLRAIQSAAIKAAKHQIYLS